MEMLTIIDNLLDPIFRGLFFIFLKNACFIVAKAI